MDLHTNDSSESAAGVFVSDKCQIPVGGIPQQEPDRQQYYMALCRQKVQELSLIHISEPTRLLRYMHLHTNTCQDFL